MSPSLTPEAAAALARRDLPLAERPSVEGGGELPLGQGGALTHNVPAARRWAEDVAAGTIHTIADCRFGPGRYTTCAACDFTCTGEDDEEMARNWFQHGHGARLRATDERRKARQQAKFDERHAL